MFFLIGVGFGLFAYQKVMGTYVEEETILYVPSDIDFQGLQQLLKDNNLVKHPLFYDFLLKKMNVANNVYGGRYVLPKGMSMYNLFKKLRGGMQDPVDLVINNINFKSDLAAKVGEQLEIDSAEFYQFLHSQSTLIKLDCSEDELMTFFIVNTYEVYWNISKEGLLDRMINEHYAFWTSKRVGQAVDLELTPTQVYVIASIVEKEYKHPEEQQRIAGVYINRINKNMKLQADPTVKFALGDLSIKRISKLQTEYDHPYNTYFNYGLPPGPIAMPETSTIDAVLNAEQHDYIYFCAREDLSGYHVFNTTYSAHLKAAKKYQAVLNKLSIYE